MEHKSELTLFEQQAQGVQVSKEFFQLADEFQKLVSKKPAPGAILKNQFANNSEYVEVGYMEMKLDQITKGLWNVEVKDVKVLGNAVVCTVSVRFFHWHFKTWVTRDGVGACPIEVKSGASPVDFSQINAKALTKNVPVAKSEAFKNACKSIGNLFGRHLNRKFQHDYVPEAELNNKFAN